uniref:Uncharacterized protein n=1 Tax=Panagrolaimus davidi TaxID=227884 RepID=A0A914QJD9_9BILA
MFNNLVQNTFADCFLTQVHGTSQLSKGQDKQPSKISLCDGLNSNKYSFFVSIIVPTIPGESTVIRDTSEIIEENSFVIKELISFISTFKKSKDIPSVIIYDKINEYKINDELTKNLPNNVPVFNITTKLLHIQEV